MRFLLTLALSLLLCGTSLISRAQEFQATVQVNYAKLGGGQADKQYYLTMQNAIENFLNSRRWSSDQFGPTERINLSVTLILENRPTTDQFDGSIQISVGRPVYGTGYTSPLVNLLDDEFNFKYVEFQPLDFNEASYTGNLTSVLGFYALVALGLDYDTYSINGGSQFFARALNVVNVATQGNEPGWSGNAGEGLRNRFWLINDLTNSRYSSFRTSMYNYHRQGMDVMASDAEGARAKMVQALDQLYAAHRNKPGSYFLSIYCNTKSTEFVNAYSKVNAQARARMASQLNEMDPTNGTKYGTIVRK